MTLDSSKFGHSYPTDKCRVTSIIQVEPRYVYDHTTLWTSTSHKYSPLQFNANHQHPDNDRYIEYLHKVLPPYPLSFCGAILPLSALLNSARY